MAIALQVEPDFRLGNLSISPRACLVSSDRGARRLQPRVMQVLVALARASGDVVTREQLIDLAWNGAVVSEDAITRTIGHIRRLSEWGEGYAFRVQTVPTIGYSLTPIEQPEIKPRSEPLLAVLPFDNISDDPALRYVSEGLSEEILQTIARGTSIRVIGRASSFQFRGGKKAAGEIARELQATHMLDGAVRRRGDRLRVTAHLMETATQTMVWSDRFDFARSETFDVQERIAELVAAALSRTFARSLRPADIDPDAYDLYLRGAELCRDIVPESQHQAIVLLEEATERAPEFADAWGELALARAQAGYLRFERRVGDARAERARIEADAARARSLDPDCPSARLIPFVGGPAFDFAEHRRQFEGPRRSRLARPRRRTSPPGSSFSRSGGRPKPSNTSARPKCSTRCSRS